MDTSANLYVEVCNTASATGTGNCQLGTDFTTYAVSSGASAPRLTSDGTNFWVAYREGATMSLARWTPGASSWTEYPFILAGGPAGDPVGFAYGRGTLNLAWGAANKLYFASCDTANDCTKASSWNEYRSGTIYPQLLAAGVSTTFGNFGQMVLKDSDPFILFAPTYTISPTLVGAQVPVPGRFFAGPAQDQVHLQWRSVGDATGYMVRSGKAPGNYSSTTNVGAAVSSLDLGASAVTSSYYVGNALRQDTFSDTSREFQVRQFSGFPAPGTNTEMALTMRPLLSVMADTDNTGPVVGIHRDASKNFLVHYCPTTGWATGGCENPANWTAQGSGLPNLYQLTSVPVGTIMAHGASGTDALVLGTSTGGTGTAVLYCTTGNAGSCASSGSWTAVNLTTNYPVFSLDPALVNTSRMNLSLCSADPKKISNGTTTGRVVSATTFQPNITVALAAVGDIVRITASTVPADLGAYRITSITGTDPSKTFTLVELDGASTAFSISYPRNVTWELERQIVPSVALTDFTRAAGAGASLTVSGTVAQLLTNKVIGMVVRGGFAVLSSGSNTTAGLDTIYAIVDQTFDTSGNDILWLRNLDGSAVVSTTSGQKWAAVQSSSMTHSITCTGSCSNSASWKDVSWSSSCAEEGIWQGTDAVATPTEVFFLQAAPPNPPFFVGGRKMNHCSWSTGCGAAGNFATYDWRSHYYGLPIVNSMDYSTSADTLDVVSSASIPNTIWQTLYVSSCKVGATGCDDLDDWVTTPVESLAEPVATSNVFRSGGTTYVLYETASMVKAAVCYGGCERTDHWTTYTLAQNGNLPADSMFGGPILAGNSSKFMFAAFPQISTSTLGYFTLGIGGAIEAGQ
ncbi:MAG: hypothetical protein QM765_09425 [Myxococcales bacterium]